MMRRHFRFEAFCRLPYVPAKAALEDCFQLPSPASQSDIDEYDVYVCMHESTHICRYVYVCPCESELLSSSGLSTPCTATHGGSHGYLAVVRGGWVAGRLAKLLVGDLAGGIACWAGLAGWRAGLDWLSTVIACLAVCRLVLLV